MSTRAPLTPSRSRNAAAKASAAAAKLRAKPYEERQQIAVVTDMAYRATKRQRHVSRKWLVLTLPGLFVVIVLLPWSLFPLLVGAPLLWWFRKQRLIERTQNNTEIVFVPWSVANQLRFMPAPHPRRKVVYLGNPVEPGLYYPAAEFHPRTFDHKVCEAVAILGSLGAVEIEVEHVYGWWTEVVASLSIPLPVSTAKAGVEGTRREGEQGRIRYKAELPNPGASPALPDDLHWYHGEQMWQTTVELWQSRRLTTVTLDATYSEDLDVTADLEGKIRGLGFKLGGQMQRAENTMWRIHGRWLPEEGAEPLDSRHAVDTQAAAHRS